MPFNFAFKMEKMISFIYEYVTIIKKYRSRKDNEHNLCILQYFAWCLSWCHFEVLSNTLISKCGLRSLFFLGTGNIQVNSALVFNRNCSFLWFFSPFCTSCRVKHMKHKKPLGKMQGHISDYRLMTFYFNSTLPERIPQAHYVFIIMLVLKVRLTWIISQ
jgi:hypothetical protein